MSGKSIDRDEPGYEMLKEKKVHVYPRGIKNLYCPYDGHYCEQPSCENCNFEKGLM